MVAGLFHLTVPFLHHHLLLFFSSRPLFKRRRAKNWTSSCPPQQGPRTIVAVGMNNTALSKWRSAARTSHQGAWLATYPISACVVPRTRRARLWHQTMPGVAIRDGGASSNVQSAALATQGKHRPWGRAKRRTDSLSVSLSTQTQQQMRQMPPASKPHSRQTPPLQLARAPSSPHPSFGTMI